MIPIAISTAIILYLMTWFVTAEPNTTKWKADDKFGLILLWFLFILIVTVIYFPNPSDVTLLGN